MKKLFALMLMTMMLSLTLVSAGIVVDPNETRTLPYMETDEPLNNGGLTRTYLFCTWRIGDQGEEVVAMTSRKCPDPQVEYTFWEDETYYIRIDKAVVGWSTIDNEWQLITTGLVDESTQEFELSVPEPPQVLLDTIFNAIWGSVQNALCQIFPFWSECSA